jgi:hypothetical protein
MLLHLLETITEDWWLFDQYHHGFYKQVLLWMQETESAAGGARFVDA